MGQKYNRLSNAQNIQVVDWIKANPVERKHKVPLISKMMENELGYPVSYSSIISTRRLLFPREFPKKIVKPKKVLPVIDDWTDGRLTSSRLTGLEDDIEILKGQMREVMGWFKLRAYFPTSSSGIIGKGE